MIKISNNYMFLKNLNYGEVIEDIIHITIRKMIKMELFSLGITVKEFEEVLKKVNKSFLRLGKYYINLDKIIAIQENIEECELKKNIKIRIIFDSDYLEVEIAKTYWDFWMDQLKTKIKN